MDSFGQPRDVLWGNLDRAIEHAKRDQQERQSEQVSLFSLLGGDQTVQRSDHYETPAERWLPRENLAKEKEVLGFYVSGHPLDRYKKELGRLDVRELVQLKSWSFFEENATTFRRANADADAPPLRRLSAHAAVVVVSHSERMTRPSVVNGVQRDGRRMAVTVLEDRSGQAELVSFENLDALAEQMQPDRLLLVKLAIGEDRREAGKVQLRVVQAESLEDKVRAMADIRLIRLPQQRCQPAVLRALAQTLGEFPGPVRVRLAVQVDGAGEAILELEDLRIRLCDELDQRILQVLNSPSTAVLRGEGHARMTADLRVFAEAQVGLFDEPVHELDDA
jgi:DNA polymerase-3 subunit alpha